MANRLRAYPNGMPHLPLRVRRRMALELLVLLTATATYLTLVPHRHLGMDIGLALAALGLIGFVAKETQERIWGEPASPRFERLPRCIFQMGLVTLPTLVAFGLYGAFDAYRQHSNFQGLAPRLCSPHFFLTLFLYVPWALAQQTLFQFYLLGRLRAILPFAPPLVLATLNGILYGVIHLPNIPVVTVTILGGVIWSYSYYRDRLTIPIALSHALLASTFYYWVLDVDLWARHF